MAEDKGVRAVLLGNSWPQRCLVENLLLNKDPLNVRPEPQCYETVKDQKLTLINAPDLLHSDLTEDRLTDLITEMAEFSSPGPHVFLLVLQPENFTEQHHLRIQSILGKFSEKPFDHAIVLLSTDQQQHFKAHQMFVKKPHLKSVIVECSYRYQWIKHFEDKELNSFARAELLTRLEQIVKDNLEDYLKYEDTLPPSQYDTNLEESTTTPEFTKCHNTTIPEELPFQMLLLGDGDKKKSKHKFVGGKSSNPEQNLEDWKEWRGKKLKIVKSANLFTMTVPEVLSELRRCVKEFHPGPNVLLLQPSAFTERNIETLRFILSLFGPNALKHSILVLNDKQNMEPCANSLLQECGGRFYIKSTETFNELMIKVETMVTHNKGSFVRLNDLLSPKINILLCGTQGPEKTWATKAMLGAANCSSEFVKRPSKLGSIVELPAMSGKPEWDVMNQCLSSISMCDPEGVHAFVMVFPLAPLTDEDKAEFNTIQNTFSYSINSFSVILFIADSESKINAFPEFKEQHEDIRDLCKNNVGYLFLNKNDPKQLPQVLEDIEKSCNIQGYTTKTFAAAQYARFTQSTSPERSFLTCGKKSEKTLRIVLIGKTGSGKSSSGNTILGREKFKCDFGQIGTTKFCQKERTRVNGCRVDVVDTPGLFDKSMSNQEINEEISKCVSLLAPGPHVFLLVLGIGRFTPEENETLNLIKKAFGSDAQKYSIVLFTNGDVLDNHKISKEDYVKEKCDFSCQKLISDCGNRVHVFNNHDKAKRQLQVKELMQKIEALVKENGGGCYTNEMLKEAEAAIQKEAERLMKEKEEELCREIEVMKEMHKQEIQEIQQRIDKEREKTERVRREKDNELREKDAKIMKERELLKEEQEGRALEEQRWLEQERVTRQQYKQDLKELEENLQLSFGLKAKESRDKMEQERKAWEAERKKWWQKRYDDDEKRRDYEQARIEKLRLEHNDELERHRKEKEEDQLRHEQEERDRKELEEQHKQQIEDLRKSYEEEARKQAEEFNEFKERKRIDFESLTDKHLEDITLLKNEIEEKEEEYQSLQNFAAHNETTLKCDIEEIKIDMEKLQTLHKQQLIDLAIVALNKQKENNKTIKEVQRRHTSEVDKCKKDIKHEYKKEQKSEVDMLTKQQQKEMKDLEKNTSNYNLPQRKRDLSDNHRKQLRKVQFDLWYQHKQKLEEEVDKIKTQHEEELIKTTQDLLRKNEKYWAQQIAELEKKQKEEMDKFMKKAKGKVDEVELDRLKTKHQIEMDKIKKRMLFEKAKCPIL